MRHFLGRYLSALLFMFALLFVPFHVIAQMPQSSISVIRTPPTSRTLSPALRKQVVAANQKRGAALVAGRRQKTIQSRAINRRNRFEANALVQRQSALRMVSRMNDAAVRSAAQKQAAARSVAQRKIASARATAQRQNNAYILAVQRQNSMARMTAQQNSRNTLRTPNFTPSATQDFPEDQKIRILLPEISSVEGEKYTLGDIAELKGSNFELIDSLSKVVLGRSPFPGAKTSITQSRILSKLRSQNISANQVLFPGASSTQIQRSALRIPGKDIDQVVLDYIKEHNVGLEIKARVLSSSRDVFLPKGEVEYKVAERGQYKKEGGYRTYTVDFQVNGKSIKKIPVRTYIKIYKDVYVARDTIKRDQLIQEKDVLKVRKNIDRAPAAYLTKKSDLIGKIARRAINSKEVLQRASLTTPPAILSGERLMIIYETPSLLLSAPGISLSKGRIGEVIPVRNLQSKTVIYATVTGKNKVQVK